MAFIRVSDSERKMLPQKIAKKASTAFDVGDVVIGTSGQVDVATSSSTLLLGLAVKKVASTDSDYASTTAIEVEQIDPNAIYEADVVTGTATAALIGTQVDLADETGLDVTASTVDVCKVVGFISATKLLVQFNAELL